jgi:Bacteriophage Lambda NinG protein
MIWERDNWTCFTCGTKIDPRKKDGHGIPMSYYMHAGHYKPKAVHISLKYDPQNVSAQCEKYNIDNDGNLPSFAVALEKRYGFGILQTLERRSRLYFDYTIPVLEKLTAIAKLGAREYFIGYEALRPKAENKKSAA